MAGASRASAILRREERVSQVEGSFCGPRGTAEARAVAADLPALVGLLCKPVPEGRLWQGEGFVRRGLFGGTTLILSMRTWSDAAMAGEVAVPCLEALKKAKSSSLNLRVNLPRSVGGQRLGKVRQVRASDGGGVRNQYVLYDGGANPKNARKSAGKPIRAAMGAGAVQNRAGKPLEIQGAFPNLATLNAENMPLGTNLDYGHMLDNCVAAEGCTYLHNRAFGRSKEGRHSIKFEFTNDRAKMASAHNFVMSVPGAEGMALQVGKLDANRYSLDVGGPMSPLQAFFMCAIHLHN